MNAQVEILTLDHEETCFDKNEISFMSFGWKCECNPELVDWSHGSSMNEKFFKFGRSMLWVEKESWSEWKV